MILKSSWASVPELITELPSLDYVLTLSTELLLKNTTPQEPYQNRSILAIKMLRALSSVSFLIFFVTSGMSNRKVLRAPMLPTGTGFLSPDYASNHLSFHSGHQKDQSKIWNCSITIRFDLFICILKASIPRFWFFFFYFVIIFLKALE